VLFAFRAFTLLFAVLALAGLALRLPSRVGTVVVVADRSLSMPVGSEAAQKEAIDLVQAAMGAEDQVAVISFGAGVALEHLPQGKPFPGFSAQVGGDSSNLGEALDAALALIPRESPGRVLVLSDGKWTGRDPAGVAPLAAARGIALDYRSMQRSAADDLAIARVDVPSGVAAGEAFLITAWVFAPTAQKVNYELRRGNRRLAAGNQAMVAGLNRLTFRDQATEAGNQEYRFSVQGPREDPVPENNSARFLIGIGGPRPLLHVTTAADSGLGRLLRKGKLDVRSVSPDKCKWTLESLAKYSAVVLENVPADLIGAVGMETLAAWVREAGGGLLMTGGRNSYGPGGYYKSPLEPVMPVSMELRNEHRKLALAIVVALDRSGSMSASVGGGKVKMDLANLGAAQVLDLLGPMDEFGCIAVDTGPHTVVDLALLKDKPKGDLRRDILRIHSEGGGIYVYEALMASEKMLAKAKAGTKHIILFADAADAVEPRDYQILLERTSKAGITVSTIGLGSEHDKDADLLRDVARRGKGRAFFTAKPDDLPRLFAQDTFVVARNTFLDERTPIRTTPGLQTLTNRPFGSPPGLSVDGYNLCYLRPGATLGTITLDEYKAPLAAAWRAGLGRVVCYTGEADGKHAGAMAKWAQAGEYFTSLARWSAGASGPLGDGMLVTQEVREGMNVVRLHLDPERRDDPFQALPRAVTLRANKGSAPRSATEALRWAGPDLLELEVPLQGTETALTTVDIPGLGPASLSPVCLPYSPEFRPSQGDRGLATLERLGRATGGKERVELAAIWKDLPRLPRRMPMARWLLALALVFLLAEVLERRTGMISRPLVLLTVRRERVQKTTREKPSKLLPSSIRKAQKRVLPPPAQESPPPEKRPTPPTPKQVVSATQETGMVEALRQARKKSRDRTN
jgi:hypothetical protein